MRRMIGPAATSGAAGPSGVFIIQEGQAVFRWATTALHPVALQACARAGVDPTELAAFVPHQANLRIIEAIARKLGAPQAIVANDIVTAGNTSSASIPLALSRMIERGELRLRRPGAADRLRRRHLLRGAGHHGTLTAPRPRRPPHHRQTTARSNDRRSSNPWR